MDASNGASDNKRRDKMKAYVYNVETNEVVFVAEGETNQDCESQCEVYMGEDEYALTYSEFGLVF